MDIGEEKKMDIGEEKKMGSSRNWTTSPQHEWSGI